MPDYKPVGDYSSDIPKPKDLDDADVRREMANVSTVEYDKYTQDKVDQRLGEPGFYSYVKAIAEGADGSGNIQDYLEGKSPDQIAELAEKYDTEIKPLLERMKKILSDEFLGKMKILKGENLTNAKDAIEGFIGKKAALDDKFVDKFSDLVDEYDTQSAKAQELSTYLKVKYRTNESGKLAKIAAESEVMAQSGADQHWDNEHEHMSSRSKIANQKGNGWSRFKNRLKSLGRDNRSDAEQAEDSSYMVHQDKLNRSIDSLREASNDIGSRLEEKEEIDSEIGKIRDQLLASLGEMGDLKETLAEISMNAIIMEENYNTNDAAESLKTMGEVWGEGQDADMDERMSEMLAEVYKREVGDAAAVKSETSINSSRMEKFNSFVQNNISNPMAKRIMTEVIQSSIDALTPDGKKSPRGAQLALMKRKVLALSV